VSTHARAGWGHAPPPYACAAGMYTHAHMCISSSFFMTYSHVYYIYTCFRYVYTKCFITYRYVYAYTRVNSFRCAYYKRVSIHIHLCVFLRAGPSHIGICTHIYVRFPLNLFITSRYLYAYVYICVFLWVFLWRIGMHTTCIHMYVFKFVCYI